MTPQSTVLLEGRIVAQSPISIEPPGSGFVEEEVTTRADGKEGKTIRRRYAVAMMKVAFGGSLEGTCYIPATTVRGALRRGVGYALMRAASEAGKPWTMHAVYENLIGQDTGTDSGTDKGADAPIDFRAISARREANPMLDLFGSGLGVKSDLLVSHAVPLQPVKPEHFPLVRKELDPDDAVPLLDSEDKRRFDIRQRAIQVRSRLGTERDLLKENKTLDKGIRDAKIAEIEAKIAEQKNEMFGLTNTTASRAPEYWAMPAGVECRHTITIRRATPVKCGQLLAGLDALSLNPFVGGQQARGCGQIAGEYHVFEVSSRGKKALGCIRVGDHQVGSFEAAGPEGEAWVEAARQAWAALVARAAELGAKAPTKL